MQLGASVVELTQGPHFDIFDCPLRFASSRIKTTTLGRVLQTNGCDCNRCKNEMSHEASKFVVRDPVQRHFSAG